MRVEHAESFEKLLSSASADSQSITFQQFEDVVKSIKLTLLFHESYVRAADTRCMQYIDYEAGNFSSNTPIVDVKAWMFAHRKFQNRWVNVIRRDPTMLKRLAVKYSLHPLALEHVLEESATRDRNRVRLSRLVRYEDHVAIVFPCASVAFRNIGGQKAGSLSIVSVSFEMISIFCTLPSKRTVISIYDERNVTSSADRRVSSSELANVDVFKGLRSALTVSYSKLRQHDGMHVVYAMLDALTDRLCDVVTILQREMEDLTTIIRTNKNIPSAGIEVMNNIEQELRSLYLMLGSSKRCCSSILEHSDLLETSGLPAYIKDIRARLEQACDETNSLNKWLERLRDESDRLLSERHSSILYSLTVVTTLFLPGEFLAAVFGMNFYNMPLIHYKYGYPLFWGSVIFSWLALFLFFRKKNLL